MTCDECIKSDVCNQKEVFKEVIRTLANTTINVSSSEKNTYSIVNSKTLQEKHGIVFNAECSKFINRCKIKM